MKTWILKSDTSRSPQVAFKSYACAWCRSRRSNNKINFARHQCPFERKIRSSMKAISHMLTLEEAAQLQKN